MPKLLANTTCLVCTSLLHPWCLSEGPLFQGDRGQAAALIFLSFSPWYLWSTQRQTVPDFMCKLIEHKKQQSKGIKSQLILQMRKQKQWEEVTYSSLLFLLLPLASIQGRAVRVNKYRWNERLNNFCYWCFILAHWVWCSTAFTWQPYIKAWIVQDPDSYSGVNSTWHKILYFWMLSGALGPHPAWTQLSWTALS